jgi:2-polyprenyl-6-methoxyphenol hydroxylase-like FAD-dependent oxidoreductase
VTHEEPCRYRFTSYYTLHQGLLEAMEPERYVMGAEVSDWQREPDRITVQLASGRTLPCDLLVAADGIQSMARRKLLPHVAPAYAGYVGGRGTVGASDLSPGRSPSSTTSSPTSWDDTHTYLRIQFPTSKGASHPSTGGSTSCGT